MYALAGFGDAAFDQARDARMTQLRQREAFAAELSLGVLRIQTAAQQFERDDLAHAIDRARGAEHRR